MNLLWSQGKLTKIPNVYVMSLFSYGCNDEISIDHISFYFKILLRVIISNTLTPVLKLPFLEMVWVINNYHSRNPYL